jgi:hypothetical protein
MEDEDDVILEKQAKIDKSNKPTLHAFRPNHPLFTTHAVSCNFSRLSHVVPNFIGGTLPRSDKGDRAAYCMTMLTLFKPWTSPANLKDDIKNFDVRYECNDASDDHFAEMKKKLAEAKKSGQNIFPSGFLSYKDKFADDLNDFDYGSDDDDLFEGDDEDLQRGPRTRRMIAEAKEMRQIMQTNGWLDTCNGNLPAVDTDQLMVPFRPRIEWVSLVKTQRMELTANKLANLPAAPTTSNHKPVPTGTAKVQLFCRTTTLTTIQM